MTQARFITFEGGEGTGKSTQIAHLEASLQAQGITCLRTREPGGSEGAELIRNLIVQGDVARWDVWSEYLLLSAGRRDHMERLIKPTLAKGTWVLCDRFIDSSRVYQRLRGLPIEKIDEIYHLISGGFEPDLTFVLDLDPLLGLNRAGKRLDEDNRFEKMSVDFHARVREAFLDLAAKYNHRCQVLNADTTVEALAADILKVVTTRFELTPE